MTDELIGCLQAKCRIKPCPLLNKAECPINKLWQAAKEMDEAKEALLAEAERIVKGKV